MAELAYTGRDIEAARAERIGLVNEVYPAVESLYAVARELAAEIAPNPPLAVQGTKFVLQQSEGLSTEQSLLLNALWTMTTTLNSDDLSRGHRRLSREAARRVRGPLSGCSRPGLS